MLEVIACVSGALVMVLEMVGARVMAPYLGTSVIVWASLIGVVLACLAAGAWLGGRLADKTLSRGVLAAILAGAGTGAALTGLAHPLIGEGVTHLITDPRLAAIVAALGLFALPATLFGMVCPYVIRLKLAHLNTSGATVGTISALSTTGSIVGTFLGGFILVSWFTSTQILLGVACGMLALSLLARLHKPLLRLCLLALTGLALAATSSYSEWLTAQGVPQPIETPYNSIRLLQGKDQGRPVRLMGTDPGYSQSGMYLDAPTELYFTYTRYYALGTTLMPRAHDVLMLGGGGYSVPKWLLSGQSGLDSENLRLTVVELDPGMTDTARRYFALPEDARMTIIHEDARRFLNANQARYDLIFMDVFNSWYSIPFHVGTQEAFAAVRRALRPGGALLMNNISALDGEASALFRAIYAALRANFAEVHVFQVHPGQPRHTVQNLMLLALPEPRPDLAPLLEQAEASALARFSRPIQDMFRARVDAGPDSTPDGPVPPLRDAFAPVERYAQALLRQ